MRLIGNHVASAANAPSHRLLGMTCLSSLDGTIPLLAASGQLDSALGAIAIGLTIVAGIGAWVAAWQAYPGRPPRRDLARLAAYAGISGVLTILAAGIGAHFAGDLVVLPHAVGAVILAIAAQVAGIRLPRLLGLAAPTAVAASAVALEVLLWIP